MDFKFEPGDIVRENCSEQNRLILVQVYGFKNKKLYIVEGSSYCDAEVLTQHEYNKITKNLVSCIANFSDYIGRPVSWIQEKYLEFILPICSSTLPPLCSGKGTVRIK